jgi:hypothetical protein
MDKAVPQPIARTTRERRFPPGCLGCNAEAEHLLRDLRGGP